MKKEIIELLKKESAFYNSPLHGIDHWKKVEINGLYLSRFTGADKAVISYFAYFHDCMRKSEAEDRKHGLRGARFAEKHRDLIELDRSQFKILTDAIKGHTYGKRPECPTVNTCWDADRLEFGRIGIAPDSAYLYSEEAKRIADENDFSILVI